MQKSVAPKKIKALRRIRLSVFFSVLQGFAHPAYAIFPQDPSFLLRLLRAGAWPFPPGQITANQKKRIARGKRNNKEIKLRMDEIIPYDIPCTRFKEMSYNN